MDMILNNYIDITLFCRFTFRLRIVSTSLPRDINGNVRVCAEWASGSWNETS